MMNLEKDTMLTSKERQATINKALRLHYCDQMGVKRVPSDYLLMFTEGGEADAISFAIATRQEAKTRCHFIREVYK